MNHDGSVGSHHDEEDEVDDKEQLGVSSSSRNLRGTVTGHKTSNSKSESEEGVDSELDDESDGDSEFDALPTISSP